MQMLKAYMNPVDMCAEIENNTFFCIDGNTYKLLRHVNSKMYALIYNNTIIDTLYLTNDKPTFGDVFKLLHKSDPSDVTLAIGDILCDASTGAYYILSKVDIDLVNLISLTNGNRWNNNIRVDDKSAITFKEISQLINSRNMPDFYYCGKSKDLVKILC